MQSFEVSPLRLVHRLLRPRDYQARPELDSVVAWWRDMRCGLCELHGIGGAGKTAIADHFLRSLPGVFTPEAQRQVRTDLPAPRAVFVFSFYEAPNADTLYRELARWLIPDAVLEGAKLPYDEIRYQLGSLSSALIVLDGLEKVQDEGIVGSLIGRVNHAQLRELLRLAADGWMPNLGILVTTRFRVEDLRDAESDWTAAGQTAGTPLAFTHHAVVDVGRLTIDACIVLLRRLGVRGSDDELARVARDSGQHALSVDLLGGYISRFLGGDAAAALALPPLESLERSAAAESDRRSRYVQSQMRRLARLAERYHDELSRRDPQMLMLLQRAGLYALGVSAETLHDAHCRIDGATDEPGGLADLDLDAIRARLDALCELHLLESGKGEGGSVYTMHPAVRDGFARAFGPEQASLGHAEAMRHFSVRLDLTPGTYPRQSSELDRFEALIVHTVGAGDLRQATTLYWRLLGGSGHLLAALGDAERGERLSRLLGLGDERTRYLAALGRVQEAIAECEDPALHADLLVRSGHLSEARRILRATDTFGDSAMLATVDALQGDIPRAIERFQAVGGFGFNQSIRINEAREEGHSAVLRMPAIQHCQFLERLGPDEEVERDIQHVRAVAARATGVEGHLYEPLICLILAGVATRRHDFEQAADRLAAAQEWAVQHHAHEVLCEVWLRRSRIANARAQASGQVRYHYCGDALNAVREGLRLAIEARYGLLAIDLHLEEAVARLLRGEPTEALESIGKALHGAESAKPPGLPGAISPVCGYVWGHAKGLDLLARARLMQLALRLGSTAVGEDSLAALGEAESALLTEAREAIDQALALRASLGDPAWADTQRLKADLDRGRLAPPPADTASASQPPSQEAAASDTLAAIAGTTPMPHKPSWGVFISYAHRDNDDTHPARRWLDRLLEHLAPMSTLGDLHIWSDRDLRPGEPWQERIRDNLQNARAAILLLSPTFLASEYIRKYELPLLLERSQQGLPIIPVVVRPCDWVDARYKFPDPLAGPGELVLGALQAPHRHDEALTALPEAAQDQVLLTVTRRLRELIQQ